MSNEKITSENLEELFDEGCDVTGFFDFDSAVVVEGRIGGACVPDPPLRLAPRLACPVNFL